MNWKTGKTIGATFAGLAILAGGVTVAFLAMAANPAAQLTSVARVPDSSSAQKARVKVVRVEKRRLDRATTQPAHLEADEMVEIHTRIGGYLRTIGQVTVSEGKTRPLDIGDRVAKDQILGELWVPEMDQDVKQKQALVEQSEAARVATAAKVTATKAKETQARAEIGQHKAAVAYRKSEYDRYRQLQSDRTVEQALVDERRNLYRSAESALAGAEAAITSASANLEVERAMENKALADVKVARANLEQSKILYDYRQIRAPFAGVITRRMADTGAFVQSAAMGKPTALFTLMRVDEKPGQVQVRIVTHIPEQDTPWVKLGQQATLRIDALRGREFPATVVRLADALDSSTRTMRVELVPDKAAEGLRPGLYGSVSIVFARITDSLMLPTSALLSAEGKPAVMIVKDGQAQKRPISIGINDGVQVQILGGLSGDEQVITDGKDALREGDPVEVVR